MNYKSFKTRWGNCIRCNLCKTRNKVVLAKGTIPCDVLFVGEAPGVSEDVVGSPFVGPAGRLLDKIVKDAVPELKTAYTNLVCCIPIEDGSVREPSNEEITACNKRLHHFVRLSKPRIIIAVGKLSQSTLERSGWFIVENDEGEPTGEQIPIRGIIHPAAILRMDLSQKGLAAQRAVAAISTLAEDFCGG